MIQGQRSPPQILANLILFDDKGEPLGSLSGREHRFVPWRFLNRSYFSHCCWFSFPLVYTEAFGGGLIWKV